MKNKISIDPSPESSLCYQNIFSMMLAYDFDDINHESLLIDNVEVVSNKTAGSTVSVYIPAANINQAYY